MKLTFIKNNYLIIWNLLYGSSISMKTKAFKQKLWITYKKEYKAIENDKDEILKDIKNYIPDDNTLYDLLEDTKVFRQLEQETEKHRLELMKSWDHYKKQISLELENILKVKPSDYQIVVLHPAMDTFLFVKDGTSIAWGKKKDLEDRLYTILQLILQNFITQIKYSEKLDQLLAISILELAILNECYTRIEKSNYSLSSFGTKELDILKKAIYPYFLMYLGIDLEDTPTYMMRDHMAFDVEEYENNEKLRDLNIFEFIDYIVIHKKRLLKIKREDKRAV